MNTFLRDERRWEGMAAFGGVGAVVLWVIGALILFAEEPDRESAQEILAYFQDQQGNIFAGGWIFLTGVLVFLWFLSALRVRFLAAEGPAGRVTALAFAAGVAVAIFLALLPAADFAGTLAGDELTPEAAHAISSIGTAFFVGAEVMAVVLVGATGVLILRTGVLPVWWAWVSFVLALWLFILPIGWLGLLVGFPAWVLVTSVLLALSARAATAPMQRPPVP